MMDLKLNNINSMADIDDAKANKLVFIPIGQLVPNPINSKELSVDDSLKESIREIGLNVPLDVIELNDGRYEISSGERRYTAFVSLIREDPDFRYQWKGNQLISPVDKGLPCTVNRRNLSDEDRDLIRLIGNKARDYDPLEQYNLFFTANQTYESKKKKGEIVRGDGRKVEWLADYLSVSERTIQKMLDDSWIVNSRNYMDVKKAGSYAAYVEQKNQSKGSDSSDTGLDSFNREYRFLDKIQSHHQKLNFEKMGLREYQIEDLRTNALETIKTIMERYGIQKRDIK
ncbi:MAG: ParB N-terminal domain-containing protein [Erysipelotrichaceae bacterium]|nr:ParB N-terminal domain-containing protein [Erysipelotrichaceae bacterium]